MFLHLLYIYHDVELSPQLLKIQYSYEAIFRFYMIESVLLRHDLYLMSKSQNDEKTRFEDETVGVLPPPNNSLNSRPTSCSIYTVYSVRRNVFSNMTSKFTF
jgi:hypothetical protein